jgi:hypothetical protein
MSASSPGVLSAEAWQRACVKSMLARSDRTDPGDARRLAAAAYSIATFCAMPPEQAAAELLSHPTIRPGMQPLAALRVA